MKFDSYHPAINFIFFAAVIVATLCFTHPVFLAISFIAAFIYSIKLNGVRALIFNIVLLVLIAAFACFYAYYTHFGVTNLHMNFAGNQITLESLVFGFVFATIVATVLMWLSCMHAIISSDKVVYLFGRISPKLSLFLSILLRMVPRIKERSRVIDTGRKCIGMGGGQGPIPRRFVNWVRRFSILITWISESLVESSRSMRSRGYSLKGRTAFSIYRFDNRDRSFVIFLFICIAFVLMAILFNQTRIVYDPMIIMNRITAFSIVFYLAYAAFCFAPLALQLVGELRFEMLRKTA
ncbi:MAG: energy-coupling factor transporter transmembrane protein EcfT [bacterium]|nr:energy-coupling factor transporter transmembrane protein EcfT [bacterium]